MNKDAPKWLKPLISDSSSSDNRGAIGRESRSLVSVSTPISAANTEITGHRKIKNKLINFFICSPFKEHPSCLRKQEGCVIILTMQKTI